MSATLRAQQKPRVALIVLGGTISGAPDAEGKSVPALDADELVRAVPEIGELAEIVAPACPRVGSHALTPADFSAVARLVLAQIEDGCEGVIVTQGTDTLEETAYALALQLPSLVPVVLTGAMRNPALPGADGPANLLAAVRVATTPKAKEFGPLVVFQDEIHAARWVMKCDSTRVSAFSSPGAGAIGTLVEERVHFDRRPLTSDYIGLPLRLDHRVEIVWTYAGCDGFFVDAAELADGLVIAAMGGGHVPPAMVDSLREAVASGIPVVLATRCVSGRILTGTYAGPGTESDLLAGGLRPAGDLHPLKARLRLLVALALGKRVEEVFPV
jgi:L-asparaginase